MHELLFGGANLLYTDRNFSWTVLRYDYNNVSLDNPADVKAYFLLKKMFQPNTGLKRKARGQDTSKAAKIRRTQNGKASAAASSSQYSQGSQRQTLSKECLMQLHSNVSHKFKDPNDLLYALNGPDGASLSRMTIAEIRQTLKIIKEHHGKQPPSHTTSQHSYSPNFSVYVPWRFSSV